MESASKIDQSLIFFWIYRALSRKLKPIRTSRRDYFPAYDLSHVLKLLDADELVEEGGDSERNGLVFQEIARQWNQIVAMLQGGTNYPAVKRLQKDLRQEQLYLRNQVLTRAKARERKGIKGTATNGEKDISHRTERTSVQNGTLRSSILDGFTLDSMERTLFALSLRSAVLDTALHLFEVYAETKEWKEWAGVREQDLSRPFYQYLIAVKEVVEHPEHSVGLASNNSIYSKVDELNQPYKANTVSRSIRENFADQFYREKPDGLKEWREFFESDAYQRHGPEGLVRQDNLL